jgi:hypothetical protein
MRCVLVVFLSVLAVAGRAYAASTAEAEQLTRENQLLRSRAALVTAGDPDSLLAATVSYLGTKGQNGPERLALITRAVQLAPDRPDLAWWHLQLCVVVASCDVKPIEAQLQTLDPKNAAGFSGSLMRSADAHDAAGVQAALTAMAASERFDVYWNPATAAMANAFIRSGALEPKAAFMVALGAAAAQWVPFKPMADACKGEALRRHDVLMSCRRLSEVLRKGDTYYAESFGARLARNLWSEGSDEWQAAARDYVTVEYRSAEDNRLLEKEPLGNAFAAKRLGLLATHRTEQEVVLADLAAAGVNPDPPPGHHGWWHR